MINLGTNAVDGTPAGGGEVLDYIGESGSSGTTAYLDDGLMQMFGMTTIVKYLIFALLLIIMCIVIMKVFKIRSPFKGRGIVRELDYMEKIRQYEKNILRANKFMQFITKVVSHTPFVMNSRSNDYWQYNLMRAGIKVPGGSRYIKPVEFHSLVTFLVFCCTLVNIFIIIFVNLLIGWVMLITTVILAYTMPMAIIRGIVRDKDLEIIDNFSDYYLMIHYVLIAHSSTPLSSIMKSYSKTTSSKEMIKFVDTCIHYIDTYGEYEATNYIAKDYREVAVIGKLMRLIRQANEGGDIEQELLGFRSELIKEKRYTIEKRMNKLVNRAKVSFYLLMPILIQAILSAMSIYLTDLGIAQTFLGGI